MDDLFDVAERHLAKHGIAVVSIETDREIRRIERLNYCVPQRDLDLALYAIYSSGPYLDHNRAKVMA